MCPHIIAIMSESSENICKCGKVYKHKTRLLTHQKTCQVFIKKNQVSSYERLMTLLKENEELSHQLKRVTSRFNNTDGSNNQVTNTTTTTTTTTTDTVRNQEFDINVYLNANFKDKKNYTDLIDRIEIVRGYSNETKKITYDDGRQEVFQFENSLYNDSQVEEESNSA